MYRWKLELFQMGQRRQKKKVTLERMKLISFVNLLSLKLRPLLITLEIAGRIEIVRQNSSISVLSLLTLWAYHHTPSRIPIPKCTSLRPLPSSDIIHHTYPALSVHSFLGVIYETCWTEQMAFITLHHLVKDILPKTTSTFYHLAAVIVFCFVDRGSHGNVL